MYRIEIDRSLCSAYGTCIDLAPDLFELSDDLVAVARIGETDDEAVVEAASACPMAQSGSSRSRPTQQSEPRDPNRREASHRRAVLSIPQAFLILV